MQRNDRRKNYSTLPRKRADTSRPEPIRVNNLSNYDYALSPKLRKIGCSPVRVEIQGESYQQQAMDTGGDERHDTFISEIYSKDNNITQRDGREES